LNTAIAIASSEQPSPSTAPTYFHCCRWCHRQHQYLWHHHQCLSSSTIIAIVYTSSATCCTSSTIIVGAVIIDAMPSVNAGSLLSSFF